MNAPQTFNAVVSIANEILNNQTTAEKAAKSKIMAAETTIDASTLKALHTVLPFLLESDSPVEVHRLPRDQIINHNADFSRAYAILMPNAAPLMAVMLPPDSAISNYRSERDPIKALETLAAVEDWSISRLYVCQWYWDSSVLDFEDLEPEDPMSLLGLSQAPGKLFPETLDNLNQVLARAFSIGSNLKSVQEERDSFLDNLKTIKQEDPPPPLDLADLARQSLQEVNHREFPALVSIAASLIRIADAIEYSGGRYG